MFCDYSSLNELWQRIKRQVNSGKLGAINAKCSTQMKDVTSKRHKGGVVEVFTTEAESDIDEVGKKLIGFCRSDIRYKTNEATAKQQYREFGVEQTTCKILQWNDGHPRYLGH